MKVVEKVVPLRCKASNSKSSNSCGWFWGWAGVGLCIRLRRGWRRGRIFVTAIGADDVGIDEGCVFRRDHRGFAGVVNLARFVG